MNDVAGQRVISAFVEDDAHLKVIGALIKRIAQELGESVWVDWRNARRGHGKVVEEFGQYLRDLKRQGGWPDFVIVATDANCIGVVARARQLNSGDCPVPVVMALPDPHIERWLLVDGAAFKKVLGKGCQAPDQKCARDRYKDLLMRAIADAGVTPGLGGIEFAPDIVAAMDLERAERVDASLHRFLDQLRQALRWAGQQPSTKAKLSGGTASA